LRIIGKARRVGDNIYTDTIISSYRKMQSKDSKDAVPYLFEDLKPPLSRPLQRGDIIVAGLNFGCGSAMEIAVEALVEAGVRAVVAQSCARTYYRNAINSGLPVLEADTVAICEGNDLVLEIGETAALHNASLGTTVQCSPVPAFFLGIAQAGGLLSYYRSRANIPKGLL